MNCPEMKRKMADWLFEPLPEEGQKHLDACPGCAEELASLKKTWDVLDEWQAPEPSAFFDAKLFSRLREEQARPSAGWLERTRAWLLYRSNLTLRPLAAGALATVLVVGGGTFAALNHATPPPADASATVRDLQSYDGNAQVFQQLNALDGDEDSGGSN